MIINIALRFILEICALISYSYWGFTSGDGYLYKFLLGIGTPLLIAFIWGTFGSPAAPLRVHGIKRLLLEIIIYGLATWALYIAGQPTLALFFALLTALNMLLMYMWDQ
ncbi:YrdB family protein [Paenisporosarcina indica]|uniref:YrdB family protein n=1 Tax=Paenisporosarcina indica TaxID=650093 RepID=UPI00094F8F9D|nr:YrdB family protein [Paenisporosarcina indica]